MIENADPSFLRIHNSETGPDDGFAIRASEPGGAVKNGVTFEIFCHWRAIHGAPVPTFDDLKAMTLDEERQIYQSLFFAPLQFNVLQSGVDYAVVDFGFNKGISGALRLIRAAFGLPKPEISYHFEPALLAALNGTDAQAVIFAICDARWTDMKAGADFWHPSAVVKGKFIGDGRAFRMNVCFGGALQFAGRPLPPTPRYYIDHSQTPPVAVP